MVDVGFYLSSRCQLLGLDIPCGFPPFCLFEIGSVPGLKYLVSFLYIVTRWSMGTAEWIMRHWLEDRSVLIVENSARIVLYTMENFLLFSMIIQMMDALVFYGYGVTSKSGEGFDVIDDFHKGL